MIVEHSFDVWIIRIRRILFELLMLDGKEGEEEERKKDKNNKIEIFAFDFLDCEEKSWNSGGVFDSSLHAFVLELLPYLKYRTPFKTCPIST